MEIQLAPEAAPEEGSEDGGGEGAARVSGTLAPSTGGHVV